MKVDYYKFPSFENTFLEDSYVLNFKVIPLIISMEMEIVLTENHFLYQKPLPNEMYCYHKGLITFSNVQSIKWEDIIKHPSKDATGEVDYGNIDEFILINGIYKITGELGNIEIISDTPKLEFE